MKRIGYILITAGFLGAALTTVLHTTEVNWTWFIICMAVGIAGVAVVRILTARAANSKSQN